MQKYILIALYFIIANAVIAQNLTIPTQYTQSTLSIKPKIGYSLSETAFNIAGNEQGTNPNILSELIWDPTNSLEYGIEVKLNTNKFIINTDFQLNRTFMGNVSDIDYDGNNRTLITSELHLSNHEGNGYTLKLQPGYDWSNKDNLSFTTYLSFSYMQRNMYLLNDKDWNSSNMNYIDGLNSYYKYKFPNYGIGGQFNYQLNQKWATTIHLEGYLSKYYAYGNWNLIKEFEKPISYEHKGNGKKIDSGLGLTYKINSSTNIGINYNFNYFNVENGKDYLYHKTDGLLKAKLNAANETKHSIFIALQHHIAL